MWTVGSMQRNCCPSSFRTSNNFRPRSSFLAPSRHFITRHNAKARAMKSVHRRCAYVINAVGSLKEAEAVPVVVDGKLGPIPGAPGVYAVYDKENNLQFVGISRKVSLSVANHAKELSDLTHTVKFQTVVDASREALTAAWKSWVEEHVQETGTIPPGNQPGEKKWQARKVTRAKPEIKLTPGKGIEDLTCTIEDLVDQVVKDNKVVAFVKGTRQQPQCGFSYQVLTLLNKEGVEYEVVNVLDEVYNPGLREAIKTYSQWPTIPQVFVNGEFIGGCDIVTEMHEKGELAEVFAKAES